MTDEIANFIPSLLASPSLLYNVIGLVIYAVVVAIIFSLFSYVMGWLERKIIAKAQYRHGPTYVGKWGIFQNLADLVKLLSKEEIELDNADRLLFMAGIPLLVAAAIFTIFLLPLSPTMQATNLSFGILLVFVIIAFTPILLFIAAFSSGNKFADISAQRSVLILFSYEIPMILVIAAIALLAKGYNIQDIVGAQSPYYFAVLMPLGLVIMFIGMLAELERHPFDLREADSELIAGWLTDVSAPYYALALFLDYARVFMGSVLMAILFFGGWLGPPMIPLPGLFWLILKAFLIGIFIIFIRATAFRMRIDRVLRFGWSWLVPLSIINLIITYIIFVR
ncbi:MAG: NADH-quinone oxidoreductase subunit H [Candidatus Micrarchaeota archaeon]|nr:NADH-quinone oxidoreductase subunit H [Candidatus Micrarchaeota archaeon]